MPARRSAASTALRNNIAIVVGPTPPTRGVIQPATSSQRLVDVGQELAALVAHAAAHDHGPGPDVLGLEDPGHPGRGDHDLGPLRVRAANRVRRCARR